MKVLYVVGSCLRKNTSANMSHNCFVQGLLENGHDVDIIMANDSWGEEDQGLPLFDKANYHIYNSIAKRDKIRKKFTRANKNSNLQASSNVKHEITAKKTLPEYARNIMKSIFYSIFKPDPVYPLDREWLKNASKFEEKDEYDLVISNSSPAASHKLVVLLKERKKIKFKRWIQIWEDPWYFDLYGGHSENIKDEEDYLLSKASEIYYVSPLTLKYQQQYFSDYANKMKFVPLPAMEYEVEGLRKNCIDISFGYFGDYYSKTRNLKFFYMAMVETQSKGCIYGDSDLQLEQTSNITIQGRVTLEKLSKIQAETDVLVHLCNLHGGQIPGKIYHYSVTKKPILFILDGTEEEKQLIYSTFRKYNRYYFCDNTKESIQKAIIEIKRTIDEKQWEKVEEFEPKKVVTLLMGEEL